MLLDELPFIESIFEFINEGRSKKVRENEMISNKQAVFSTEKER